MDFKEEKTASHSIFFGYNVAIAGIVVVYTHIVVVYTRALMKKHYIKQGPDLIDLRRVLEGVIFQDIWLFSSLTED